MNYQLVKQVRENSPLRKSFIDLAVKTFDLSFEEWYQQGYWTDAYIPYAFVERNKIIANASANIIDLAGRLIPYCGGPVRSSRYQSEYTAGARPASADR